MVRALSDAPVFGGSGAPTGMFLITGSGMNVALLKLASKLPIDIGPSTVTPFFTKLMPELGCVHIEPWKVSALFVNWIAVEELDFSETRVSIELLPLVPCQAFAAVLHGLSAQRAVPFPLKVIAPATSITPVPV